MTNGGQNNEARIRIGAQEEVSDSLARITVQLGKLEQRMKESGRQGRAVGQNVKAGLEEGGKAAEGLGASVANVGKALGAVLSVDVVRRFFGVWVTEQRKAMAETEKLASLLANTLGGTGDLLSRGRIQQQLGAIGSPLTPAERVEVFRSARDAAPGLPTDESMRIVSSAIRRVGATGAGGQNTAAAAGFGARLAGLGVTNAGESVDAAFASLQRMGARANQAPQIGAVLEELLAGIEGPERASVGRQLLAAMTVAAGSGQSPEVFRSLAGQVEASRSKTTASGLTAFPQLGGMSTPAAVLAMIDGGLNLPVEREMGMRLGALRGQSGARADFLASLGSPGALDRQIAAANSDPALRLTMQRAQAESAAAFSRLSSGTALGWQVYEAELAERRAAREAAGMGVGEQWIRRQLDYADPWRLGRALDDGTAVRRGEMNGFAGERAREMIVRNEIVVRSDGADAYVGG